MAFADLIDDEIVVETDWVEKDLAQQIPGMNYRSADRRWHGPLSWGTCVVLRGVFGDRLIISEGLRMWAWEQWHGWIEENMQLRDQATGVSDDDDSPEARIIKSWR